MSGIEARTEAVGPGGTANCGERVLGGHRHAPVVVDLSPEANHRLADVDLAVRAFGVDRQRARLVAFVGALDAATMRQVCRALAVATGCLD